MNKNTIILITVISIIVLTSIGITFYLLNQNQIPSTTEPQQETTTNTGTAFPSSGKIRDTENEVQNTENIINNNVSDEQSNYQSVETGNAEIKRITDKAVAGITFIKRDGQTFIRYIEKGTGHIKEIAFNESIPTNITNTTITSIYDSFWGKDGETLIFRRLDGQNNNIQTIYGTIENNSSTSTEGESGIKKLSGVIMPNNITEIAVSPDKNRIFYITVDNNGSIGLISDFQKGGPSNKNIQIWKSPIKEWKASWLIDDKISLQTKASSNISGYLYELSTGKGNLFKKELGDILGLTSIISKTGKNTVYSETTGTGFMTYYLDTESEGESIFPVQTLPEKCVFSRLNENIAYCGVPKLIIGSKYPDSWYQGISSFSDEIWKIDLDVNFSGRIINSEKLGNDQIDLINPILSEDENYLGFINKKDNTPWIIKID